ncbi:hypothetical protein D3C80_2193810 [compost metagenome]
MSLSFFMASWNAVRALRSAPTPEIIALLLLVCRVICACLAVVSDSTKTLTI